MVVRHLSAIVCLTLSASCTLLLSGDDPDPSDPDPDGGPGSDCEFDECSAVTVNRDIGTGNTYQTIGAWIDGRNGNFIDRVIMIVDGDVSSLVTGQAAESDSECVGVVIVDEDDPPATIALDLESASARCEIGGVLTQPGAVSVTITGFKGRGVIERGILEDQAFDEPVDFPQSTGTSNRAHWELVGGADHLGRHDAGSVIVADAMPAAGFIGILISAPYTVLAGLRVTGIQSVGPGGAAIAIGATDVLIDSVVVHGWQQGPAISVTAEASNARVFNSVLRDTGQEACLSISGDAATVAHTTVFCPAASGMISTGGAALLVNSIVFGDPTASDVSLSSVAVGSVGNVFSADPMPVEPEIEYQTAAAATLFDSVASPTLELADPRPIDQVTALEGRVSLQTDIRDLPRSEDVNPGAYESTPP